jgi:hypothetical protein
VTNSAKAKGDRAELEVSRILSDQLGTTVRRKLGAGRTDDEGDLEGLPGWCIEVKNYADITRAVREGLDDCSTEQANSGLPFGVALIRRPGGRWFAAMTIEQFSAVVREVSA